MILYMVPLAIMILGLIFANIDWKKLAEKWVAYNPHRARIFVRTGEVETGYDGKLLYASPVGWFYTFRWGKRKVVIGVPDSYPHINLRGRRKIMVLAGHGIAAWEIWSWVKAGRPQNWIDKKIVNATQADGQQLFDDSMVSCIDLDAAIESDIGVKAIKSLKSKNTASIFLIIIILGALIFGFFLFKNNFMGSQPNPSQQNIPAQSQGPKSINGVPIAP